MARSNLAFLASHNGSGMREIVRAAATKELDVTPTLVVSNNAQSSAMAYAAEAGIKAVHMSQTKLGPELDFDTELEKLLLAERTDYVVLSGYLLKLGPKVLKTFYQRILNIHPSLLPAYGGKGMFGERVHQAVLSAGEKQSGASVHYVDAEYDTGTVIAQKRVPIMRHDTVQSLAKRVASVEGALLLEALASLDQR